MRVSVVGMGRCRQRISASRSGGETTAASHSADRLGGEEERRRESKIYFCAFVTIPPWPQDPPNLSTNHGLIPGFCYHSPIISKFCTQSIMDLSLDPQEIPDY